MNYEKFRKEHFHVEKRIWEIITLVQKYDIEKCSEIPKYFAFSFGVVFVHLESLKVNNTVSWKLAFPFEWLEMPDNKVVMNILKLKKNKEK
jgi:hypothetical protein